MSTLTSDPLEFLRRSLFLQVLVIGGLIILLQIPVLLIAGLVSEREATRLQAVQEITSKWGQAQPVVGPFLVVPYRYARVEEVDDGAPRRIERETVATFLPSRLAVDGQLAAESRYRGIFEAPVYRAELTISGDFGRPDFSGYDGDLVAVLWDRAQLVLEIGDARGLQNLAQLQWDEQRVSFAPGTGARRSERPGIHVPLALDPDAETHSFSTELQLNGSMAMSFAPLGQQTEARLRSGWLDPSFSGAWLPSERRVDGEGFEATWSIPHLGRNYPSRWYSGTGDEVVQASLFGVDLLTPVDAHRQTERSLKYQILFLGLTFVTLWLFEVIAGVRVHWIQYGLIGMAMCLFYLLELSLGEHIGFGLAYVSASTAVIALVTLYGRAVLRSAGRSAWLGGVLTGLYGCLYVLLQLEDYALVVGSVGLFAALAAIMYLTRGVDWSSPRRGAPA